MKSLLPKQQSTYKYSPLDPTKREIRLLHVIPGSTSTAPHCRIETVSLDDGPEFVALSYAWGQSLVRKRIHVDGKVVYLTRNLFDALVQFQSELHTSGQLSLWADAVSIIRQVQCRSLTRIGLHQPRQ
jgi:hypothetical protein